MNGHEFKEIRLSLGLSQVELAKLMGTRPNTIYRREAEIIPITEEAAALIRCIQLKTKRRRKFTKDA